MLGHGETIDSQVEIEVGEIRCFSLDEKNVSISFLGLLHWYLEAEGVLFSCGGCY